MVYNNNKKGVDLMSFNERLKKIREVKGFTQQEVADKVGKKKNSISNWEMGIARPDVDTLAKLCKLYGVSPDSLFEEFDDIEDKQNEFKEDEQKLIESFRKLNPLLQEYVLFSVANAAEHFRMEEAFKEAEIIKDEYKKQAPSTQSELAV